MEMEKQAVIVVVNIPPGLSAADVQSLVNGSLQDGTYYFAGVTPYESGAWLSCDFVLRNRRSHQSHRRKHPQTKTPPSPFSKPTGGSLARN
jgi:hypothetical protein